MSKKEPGNGSDNCGQTDEDAKNFQNEPACLVSDVKREKAHNDEQRHCRVRQVTAFDLVKQVHVWVRP